MNDQCTCGKCPIHGASNFTNEIAGQQPQRGVLAQQHALPTFAEAVRQIKESDERVKGLSGTIYLTNLGKELDRRGMWNPLKEKDQ